MLKSKKVIILLSVVNAVLMTAFTFLWVNNSDILTDDEEYLIKITSGVQNTLFKAKEKPKADEVLFVDIAWEKQLITEKDANGVAIGRRAITDRSRVAEFLSYVNKNNAHKFIILDVFFKDSSNWVADSLLQAQFSKTKNILVPYHENAEGVLEYPIFDTPVALSDYGKDEVDNNFVKFKCLYKDSVRTTPLVMYERLHGNEFKDYGLFGVSNGSLALSSFILDMRVWSQNLIVNKELESLSDTTAKEEKYQVLYLSDMLCDGLNPYLSSDFSWMPEEDKAMMHITSLACAEEQIRNLTKDRIVVVGDFSDSDIHETIYGATPGPLILYNIYLALKAGDNLFSIWFILFLLVGFYFISYNCFSGKDFFISLFNSLTGKVKQLGRASFFMNFIGYLLYFIILSILSFYLFNIHITILLLAVYMEVLDKAVVYLKNKKGKAE